MDRAAEVICKSRSRLAVAQRVDTLSMVRSNCAARYNACEDLCSRANGLSTLAPFDNVASDRLRHGEHVDAVGLIAVQQELYDLSAITNSLMPICYAPAGREVWIFLHLSERSPQLSRGMLRRKKVSNAGSHRGSGGVHG